MAALMSRFSSSTASKRSVFHTRLRSFSCSSTSKQMLSAGRGGHLTEEALTGPPYLTCLDMSSKLVECLRRRDKRAFIVDLRVAHPDLIVAVHNVVNLLAPLGQRLLCPKHRRIALRPTGAPCQQ